MLDMPLDGCTGGRDPEPVFGGSVARVPKRIAAIVCIPQQSGWRGLQSHDAMQVLRVPYGVLFGVLAWWSDGFSLRPYLSLVM